MSVEGLILHHGEVDGVTLHQTRVDYLLTAERSKQCSVFEFSIAPGFNTAAHNHTRILITAPPGHEKYFDELRDLIAKGGKPDPEAFAKLRAKYDTIQLATLTPG
jgi:predicted metal-dependent enzyme (double-stranded beta helix superfamily)